MLKMEIASVATPVHAIVIRWYTGWQLLGPIMLTILDGNSYVRKTILSPVVDAARPRIR